MDKLKSKASSARNRAAERLSRGTGVGSLSEVHSTLPPNDNASTTAVNEGFLGPQPATAARDFAAGVENTPQPTLEPPTSLQSSVDAGVPVPQPSRRGGGGRPRANSASLNASRQSPPRNGRRRSSSDPRQGMRPTTTTNRPPNRPTLNPGFRQPSIGLRRAAPSQPLQAVPVVPSTQLPSAGARLPVLDETAALEHHPTRTTTASTGSPASSERGRMGPLAKIKSKLGFGGDGQRDANGETARRPRANMAPQQGREYTASMVDVLDTLDAEVQTITSLTNVQNSLFIPNLGRWVNRQPTYVLRQSPSERQSLEEINRIIQNAQAQEDQEQEQTSPGLRRMESQGTLATIDSNISESRFAVLPHGTSLDGWTKEEKAELNDHVRHMLHSKRSKFKRAMRGFGQYVRRPLGFLVTLYATLITLFGLAWVLFLIGWINVGGRQIYVVHIIDSVLVALFAIVGDGLAPFRAVDTYHMIYIAHYHMYTWDRRKKDQLPKLHDHNDLPSSNAPISGPVAKNPEDPESQWEFTVLTPKQQAKLEHHQAKFCKSHSFYKPHETDTHYAFPLRLLIAIVVLLDCHSLLQISLGACTWGIYYKVRPFALTTVILCCSITCNATAGLLILIGDRRTRKKDVLERMNRQELTEEAMHKIQKKRDHGSESEDNEDGAKSKKSMDARRSMDVFRKSLHKEREKDGLSQTSPPPVPPKDYAEKSAYP